MPCTLRLANPIFRGQPEGLVAHFAHLICRIPLHVVKSNIRPAPQISNVSLRHSERSGTFQARIAKIVLIRFYGRVQSS